MKKTTAVIITSLMLLLGTYFPAKAQENKKLNLKNKIFIEKQVNSNGSNPLWLSIDDGKKDVLRLTTPDYGTNDVFNIGIKTPIGKVNGEIIGQSFDNGSAIGYNGRINTSKFNAGFSLERLMDEGTKQSYVGGYFRLNSDNIRPTLGIIKKNGETRDFYSLDKSWGRNLIGIGFNGSNKDFLSWAIGRYAKEAGKDSAYRLRCFSYEGKQSYQLLFATKSTLSKGSIAAMISMDDGVQDPGLFTNKMDFSCYTWERTVPTGLVVDVKLNEDSKSIQTFYRLAETNGFSPLIGLGYSDDTKTGVLGLTKGSSYLVLTAKDSNGEKTYNTVLGVKF